MRYQSLVLTGLLVLSVQAGTAARATGQGLPLKNGRPAVATVNRDVISLDEYLLQAPPTANRARLLEGRGTADEVALLDRLVIIKLAVQEAARMGLDEVPEIRKQVEVTSREILREVLLARLVKNVGPDPVLAEKLFREAVKEWKTQSLLFHDQAAATRAQKEIDAGGAAFAEVAAKAVAAKAAKADSDAGYHPRKDYLPQIAEAIAPLQPGHVSPVIRLPAGFVVVKLVDVRYPENAQARAEARKAASVEKQQAFLKAHEQEMRRRYVVVNEALVKSIDYEAAKPGVDALLADKRPVAEIKGGQSVSVGDLTDYLRLQFFHGDDPARQHKEMNAKKQVALDATIGRRLLNMEALRLGIDKTSVYRDRLQGYKDSLVFDAFLQKVVAPESKVKEDEAKAYYSSHLKEYSSPEMLKLRSLAFTRRNAAEAAMKKLREGTDYGWLATNAEGQLDKGAQGVMTFDGRPVTTDSMPEGVRKALAGSKPGEHRLYPSAEGAFYVLSVQQVIASNPKPYTEVREDIAKKLYAEKLKKNVEGYGAKLRAKSRVEIYLKRVR